MHVELGAKAIGARDVLNRIEGRNLAIKLILETAELARHPRAVVDTVLWRSQVSCGIARGMMAQECCAMG